MAASNDETIPIIELCEFEAVGAAERSSIARRVDNACRQVGFLIIEDHGVSQPVIDRAWDALREFFDLPLAQKLVSDAAGGPRGYFPVEMETLARTRDEETAPDIKEAFSSGPLSLPVAAEQSEVVAFFYGDNRWPTRPAGFCDAWTDYYRAMESLGARLMTLLATALELDPGWFEPFHTHHTAALRGLNYPSVAADTDSPRAGAHSDYGTVTILRTDPQVGGLELQLPTGAWISAPRVRDGFIVNLGDLMAVWTGGRWASTLHRVVADSRRPNDRRQSIAYFMNPNYDALIEPIGGGQVNEIQEPFYAGDYVLQKFRLVMDDNPQAT